MADDTPKPDRRRSGQGAKLPGGRRVSDRYWTVPEIAEDLGVSESTVRRKFLGRDGGAPLLECFDFDGTIRVRDEDFQAFKARHFKPRAMA